MKKNNGINIDWLVCPVTKTELKLVDTNLLESKERKFIFNNHHWDFIPTDFEELNNPLWKTWEKLQRNGVVSYENSPQNNLGVGPRKDYIQFGDFCKYHGLVLDIGVGPQDIPSHVGYIDSKDFQFVGIDPLEGTQPRKFAFVKGLGEYLPFKDNLFDQVIFATSLDHFIDPVIALLEAERVIKNTGEICIWIGEKDKNTPKPKQSPIWYKDLSIPEGAEDPFHFKRFSLEELYGYIKRARLKIVEEKEIIVDQWRKNYFFRTKKNER